MTRAEWAVVMQRFAANWPRHPLPDLSAAKFYDDLKGYDAKVVTAAVEALFRAGREFPPTSAHVLDEIAAQTVDAPPFREAWNLLLDGIRRHGCMNAEAVVQHVASHAPVVAEWAARCDIREIGMSQEGDTTVYAQHRQHYETTVARARRAVTHLGLPAATVPELRPGTRGLRRTGAAVGELVARLEPERGAA